MERSLGFDIDYWKRGLRRSIPDQIAILIPFKGDEEEIMLYKVPLGVNSVIIKFNSDLREFCPVVYRNLNVNPDLKYTRVDVSFSNGHVNTFLYGNGGYIGVIPHSRFDNFQDVRLLENSMPEDIADFIIGNLTQANLLERFVLECGKPTKLQLQ